MLVLKNPKIAVPVVLFAGLVWSFGPLVVRYMDNPHLIPWQYIFGRGLTIFILLNFINFKFKGGHLMREAFELGWLNAYLHVKGICYPEIFNIDDIQFL